ncbi:auxin-induced protein 22D-like [Mercurialis annua]|uniref:auxin-induced protein 22D-like n=1 Tax=Mercurialis annua TaxID=3986 RepID=UPI00215FD10B|nr:auxin-induced protein 22D-like [Mercurialis annua]
MAFERDGDLNLEATELRLGLPGATKTAEEFPTPTSKCNKRSFPESDHELSRNNSNNVSDEKNGGEHNSTAPPSKAQVVGWPPIRSYRKNCFQAKKSESEVAGNGNFVKVSMDGAPYLRKIDLKMYKCYPELLKALEDMFKFKVGKFSEREGFNGSEFVPTYEDKDGDWMLAGDVPWEMFINSCKKLRIMKGSEARGLGCAL